MPSAVREDAAGPDPAAVRRFAADLAALGPSPDARFGIALSGGPDSVALLLLAAAAHPGRVAALTVDHGLRAEAADEAAAAGRLAHAIGVPHDIHRAAPFGTAGGVQAAARKMRYAALDAWAKGAGIAAMLTAHHADDQAETMLMRLARGAGPGGLAGIRAARALSPGVMLLRPLLGWRKRELASIVAAAGIEPILDPSNTDRRYDRTLARETLAAAPWLAPPRIAAAAAHIAAAEAALETIADERYAVRRDGGDVLLSPDPLDEIARRHLRRLLDEAFAASPDGPSLERALRALRDGGTTTCADVVCRAEPGEWRFRRAPPRRAPNGA